MKKPLNQNPTKKDQRKGIEKLERLLNNLKGFNIKPKQLMELTQPAFKGNIPDFANIYKHALNLNINDYKIIGVKLLNRSIFEVKVKINYDFRLPAAEKEGYLYQLRDINFETNIRIVPELRNGTIDAKGIYMPNIIFISEMFTNAIKEEQSRNN